MVSNYLAQFSTDAPVRLGATSTMRDLTVTTRVARVFAKLICASGSKEEEIDCRPSDAVALAYRFGCPIYCEEEVLKLAGIGESEIAQSNEEVEAPVPAKPKRRKKSLDALKNDLAKAIAREDYEQASRLRDEIEQRQENQ